ncbi:hypothetical protein ACGFOU_19240 [Streptomyces sp. NPDC048595]|uniref:hypothetical protein n=1 Tax=Streptomyces sp. NPDC048595 TaxID=3365576 RepID=UPI0037227901
MSLRSKYCALLPFVVVALLLTLAGGTARSASPAPQAAAPSCRLHGDGEQAAEELKMCTPAAVDELFHQSPAGAMPHGTLRGQLLHLNVPLSSLDPVFRTLGAAAWRGKEFRTDSQGGHVHQIVEPFGQPEFVGEVDRATFPDDGRRAIRLVYRQDTGGMLVDWMRAVRPHVYVGVAMWGPQGAAAQRLATFVLYP